MIFSSYVIHIYRFHKNKSKPLVGVVEEIGTKGKKAFTNYDELWEILSSPSPLYALPKGKNKIKEEDFGKNLGEIRKR